METTRRFNHWSIYHITPAIYDRKNMKKLGFTGVSLFAIAAAGCTHGPDVGVGLPNPASEFCVEQGGRLEIRKEAGGDVGYCHLPDGRVIEEWAFFRSK